MQLWRLLQMLLLQLLLMLLMLLRLLMLIHGGTGLTHRRANSTIIISAARNDACTYTAGSTSDLCTPSYGS